MSLDPEPETPMNILRPSQFAKKLGVSVPTIWRRTQDDPAFPKAIRLSAGISGFVEAECNSYLELKLHESRSKPSKRATVLTASAASVEKRASNRLLSAAKLDPSNGGAK